MGQGVGRVGGCGAEGRGLQDEACMKEGGVLAIEMARVDRWDERKSPRANKNGETKHPNKQSRDRGIRPEADKSHTLCCSGCRLR